MSRVMSILSAVLLIGLLAAALQAETAYPLDWTRQIAPSVYTDDNDECFAVDTDAAGNVFVSGYTYDTGPDYGAYGLSDSFVSKYDTSGTLLWRTQYEDFEFQQSYGVATDMAGNVFSTGYTTRTFDGNFNVFLRKLDASTGSLDWERTLASPDDKSELGAGVATDTAGNIFISGWTAGNLDGTNAGLTDAFVSKYNTSGTLQWTSRLGTAALEESSAITTDSSGNVFISGFTKGSLDGSNAGGYDAFFSKYNTSGALQWTRQLGTPGDDYSSGVATDSSGNIYISGRTGGSLGGQAYFGGTDAFVSKYDSSGTPLWTRQLGTSSQDGSYGVDVDASGNVFISGFTNGNLDGTSAGSTDAFVSKYDTSGTLLWTNQLGTSEQDSSHGVAVDSDGNVFISGRTDGDLAGTNLAPPDGFLAKYNAPEPDPATVTFTLQDNGDGTFAVYASSSAGDNVGLSFYNIELENITSASDVAPSGVSPTWVPFGFQGEGLDLPNMTPAAPMWTLFSYQSSALDQILYGIGQTSGTAATAVGPPSEGIPWEALVLIATGTYDTEGPSPAFGSEVLANIFTEEWTTGPIPDGLVEAANVVLVYELLIPGDFDGDGDVDGVDFGIWQASYPMASGATLGTGDADGDGDVDGVDFGICQAAYPRAASAPVAGGATVPEPATLGLLLAGGFLLLRTKRRLTKGDIVMTEAQMQRKSLDKKVIGLFIGMVCLAMSLPTGSAMGADIQVTVNESTLMSPLVNMNTGSITCSREGIVGVFYPKPQLPDRQFNLLRTSSDAGLTWGPETWAPSHEGGAQEIGLSGGGVIKLRTSISDMGGGWYNIPTMRGTDDFTSWVRDDTAKVYVPNHMAAGDVPLPGLSKGPIIQIPTTGNGLNAGDLLMPMFGHFTGDISHRSYLVRSTDLGYTWTYHATMVYFGADPTPGSGGEFAGAVEPTVTYLPNGDLLAVIRTNGDPAGRPEGDFRPLYTTKSTNGGLTWTTPAIAVVQAGESHSDLDSSSPTLAVLNNGVVALEYGRPGFHVAFSTDYGATWGGILHFSELPGTTADPNDIESTGQFDMTKAGPNKLVAFGSDIDGAKAWPITVNLMGDVNCDGWVDGDDQAIVTANWNQYGNREQGDLTGDGYIGQADQDELTAYWLTGIIPGGAAAATIPEPATLAMMLAGGLVLLRRRRTA